MARQRNDSATCTLHSPVLDKKPELDKKHDLLAAFDHSFNVVIERPASSKHVMAVLPTLGT